jgi:hypothetical protein
LLNHIVRPCDQIRIHFNGVGHCLMTPSDRKTMFCVNRPLACTYFYDSFRF